MVGHKMGNAKRDLTVKRSQIKATRLRNFLAKQSVADVGIGFKVGKNFTCRQCSA